MRGSKGIGAHKHGTSGRVGPSPKAKLNRMLEANKATPKRRPSLSDTVKEAFESKKK